MASSNDSDPPKKLSDRQQFQNAVADSLFAWASLEDALVTLLQALLGRTHEIHFVSAIYFAPSNLETRFRIVDRVLAERLRGHEIESEFIAEWSWIFGRLNKLKNIRNSITHGSLVMTPTPGQRQRVLRLAPQLYDIQRRRSAQEIRQIPGMSAADIVHHISNIHILKNDVELIRDLCWALNSKSEPLLQRLRALKERHQK